MYRPDRHTSRYTYKFKPRTLSYELDDRRYSEADIQFYTYVKPLGNRGLHVVRLTCNEEEIVVSGVQGGATYAPGSVVPVGSYTNTPGKFIIGSPPPGRKGTSSYALTPATFTTEVFGLTSANPNTIQAGETLTDVVFTGFGLKSGDSLAAVAWYENPVSGGWVEDPDVSVSNVAFVSSTTMTADVMASGNATPYRFIHFSVSR